MSSATLRTFLSSDISAALALWRNLPGIGLTAADSPPALTLFLQRNPGLSRVAVVDGVVVGTVLCGHDGRRAFLYHLAVAPAHRHRGIGQALVRACTAHLQRLGLERTTIHLFAANDEGKAFWRDAGWRERSDLAVLQVDLI